MVSAGDQSRRASANTAPSNGTACNAAPSWRSDPCVGVGMTPPNVPDAVALVVGHDQQDVRRALRRHHGGRPLRLRLLGVELIVAAKFRGGFGRYLPSIVVVALGEPGVPVVCCWAYAAGMPASIIPANDSPSQVFLSVSMTEPLPLCRKGTRGAERRPYLTAIFRRGRQQGYWTKGQLSAT